MEDGASRYDRNTINARNPLARFAHRTRLQRGVRDASDSLPNGGLLLDFGAGSGRFLLAMKAARPDATVIGVEPFMSPPPGLEYRRAIGEQPDHSVDVVTCFEVCEHLYDAELEEFIAGAQRILRTSGRLVVSVPITLGLGVPLKAVNQALFSGGSEWSTRETIRGTLGLPIARSADRRSTHKGFDFRLLREKLSARFDISKSETSPVRGLPWFVSSQMFFICVPRRS